MFIFSVVSLLGLIALTSAQTVEPTPSCDLTICASLPFTVPENADKWYKCKDNPKLCLPKACRCDGHANCLAGGKVNEILSGLHATLEDTYPSVRQLVRHICCLHA